MTTDLTPYLAAIRRWNPALDIQSVRVDPYGLNNLVLIVNDAWVCRFPRNPAARDALRQEAAVLAVVRPHVRVAVPEFEGVDGQEFVAYRLLPGRPLYRHDLLRLDERAQARFADGLAAFLHDLHAIPPRSLLPVGLPYPAAAEGEAAAGVWEQRLAEIRAELYPHLWADQHAAIEDLFAPVRDGRLDMAGFAPALIHNDLASYHLLVDRDDGRLTGVLDFGAAGWGDPAADYGTLINTYGETLLNRMIAARPEVAALVERARFRAAYLELEWALKGLRTGDPGWYLVHLGRARDSRPFGG